LNQKKCLTSFLGGGIELEKINYIVLFFHNLNRRKGVMKEEILQRVTVAIIQEGGESILYWSVRVNSVSGNRFSIMLHQHESPTRKT